MAWGRPKGKLVPSSGGSQPVSPGMHGRSALRCGRGAGCCSSQSTVVEGQAGASQAVHEVHAASAASWGSTQEVEQPKVLPGWDRVFSLEDAFRRWWGECRWALFLWQTPKFSQVLRGGWNPHLSRHAGLALNLSFSLTPSPGDSRHSLGCKNHVPSVWQPQNTVWPPAVFPTVPNLLAHCTSHTSATSSKAMGVQLRPPPGSRWLARSSTGLLPGVICCSLQQAGGKCGK